MTTSPAPQRRGRRLGSGRTGQVTLEEEARELGLRADETAAVELEVAFVGAVGAKLLALGDEAVDLRPHRLDGVLVGIHKAGQGTPGFQEFVLRNVNFVRSVTRRRGGSPPIWKVPRMDFDLSPEHELVRDTVRQFALEQVAPVAEELDREKRFPYELVAELAELGLMGMTIPEEYGGGGTDTLSYAIAIEELTRIDSSVAITVAAHHSLGTLPIYLFGSEEQRREWLPDLASRPEARRVRADRAGRRLRRAARRARPRGSRTASGSIDGSKIFITNAGTDITRLRDDHRPHGRRRDLEPDRPERHAGYVISAPMQKLGWRASDTRELSFQGARVPEGNLLGARGAGLKQFLQILDGGRISVAAMGVGLAQGCYDLASAYAKEREQFGKPIASFQAVQQKLVDMATEIEAARALVYKAAWEKDQGRDFARTAAMAKLYSGELSHRAANWALQIHGGYGFMDEYPISRLYRDQKILEIGEGTNEVQRMVIARHLGLTD